MESYNILSILSLVIVFISLLFSLFLFTVKTRNKLANVLLGLFILFNAIDISAWFLNQYMQDQLNLLMFRARTSWLINPLFYLYALALCYSDFKLKAKHLLHAIPWVVVNLTLIPRYYSVDQAGKTWFLEHYDEMPDSIFNNALGHLQFIFYIIGIYLVLRKYKRIYLENYADAGSITYNWLFQLVTIITIVHSIVMVKDIFYYTRNTNIFGNAQILVAINAMLLLCWFVLKALYNPTLFRTVDSGIRPVNELVGALPASQASSGLPPPVLPPAKEAVGQEMEAKIQQLKHFMEQEAPYEDAGLTVQILAARMKMPARDLSLLINHHLGQHFFDFINEYRIQQAMRHLKDPAKQGLTIQEIFYKVGFNSKSSFNTAFKKYTGMTPTQYRGS